MFKISKHDVALLLFLLVLGAAIIASRYVRNDRWAVEKASAALVGHANHPRKGDAKVSFDGKYYTVVFPMEAPPGIAPGHFGYEVKLDAGSQEVESIEFKS